MAPVGLTRFEGQQSSRLQIRPSPSGHNQSAAFVCGVHGGQVVLGIGDWFYTDAPPAWAATFGAAAAVYYSFRTWQRERQRDSAEQASLVAVWPHKAHE